MNPFLLVVAWLGMGLVPPVQAQTPQVPAPAVGEARMVTFDYDDDRIYKVLVRPRNTTQLKLAADERVNYVSAGDASSFAITVPSSKAFVEVKPKWDHVTTNLLVVTNRRTYHVELLSTGEGRKWYTRVAWQYANAAVLDQTQVRSDDTTVPALAALPGVAVDKLFFKYGIEGDAPFRPAQVFDDGTHTYIRLPDDLQELPALFVRTPESDDIALVNYSIHSPYLVVPRTMEKFVLKLGKREVDVVRLTPQPSWFSRLRFGRGGS